MLVRLLVVIAVVAVSALVVSVFERRRTARTAPGLGPGVVLVTGEGCGLCGPARRSLDASGVAYREIDVAESAHLGVRSLPTLMVIGHGGEVLLQRSGRSAVDGAGEVVAWGS